MNDQDAPPRDVATALAVLWSEVKGMRSDLTGRFAALATRVDRHQEQIDSIHERQIRADERERVRKEGRRDGNADGQLVVQRSQLYIGAGIGILTIAASLLNIALSHF